MFLTTNFTFSQDKAKVLKAFDYLITEIQNGSLSPGYFNN